MVGAVSAVLAAAGSASATSTVAVVDGSCVSVASAHGCLFTGNIDPNTVSDTQNAYNLYNDTHPSAAPDITLDYLFKSDDPGKAGTLTSGGTSTASGTWATPGFLVDFIAVKSSNDFVLYKLAAPASSGSWNTLDIPYGKNPHDLSHLAFFGEAIATTVPEPGAWALMLMGFGAVGVAARRRTALRA
jgi:hypothetical protein